MRVARTGVPLTLLALCLAWLLGALLLAEPRAVGLFHDDGIYVAAAQSLATGQGYRIASLPQAPWQTKYPVLFPLLLVPVWMVAPSFPENALGFQIAVILFGAALIPLSYLTARRLFGLARGAALAVAAMLAGSAWLLGLTRWVLTELPYAALALGALLWCQRTFAEPGRAAAGSALFAGFLCSLGLLLKAQGVVLALAVAALLVSGRRWRDLSHFAIGWTPAPLVWHGWRMAHAEVASSPLIDYYVSYRASMFDLSSLEALRNLASVVAQNVQQALVTFGMSIGAPDSTPLFFKLAIVTLFVALGLAFAWRRGHRLAVLYFLFYLASTVAVPWTPVRYLLPLLPLVLALFVLTFETAAARLIAVGMENDPPRQKRRLRLVRTTALLLVSALLGIQVGGQILERTAGGLPGYVEWTDPFRDWPGFQETIDWLRENTAPADVVASPLDPFYHLHTGRRGLRYWRHNPVTYFYPDQRRASPSIGSAREIVPELRRLGVRWLIREPALFDFFAEGRAVDALAQEIVASCGDRAQLVFRSSDSGHFVYRLDWAESKAAPQASKPRERIPDSTQLRRER